MRIAIKIILSLLSFCVLLILVESVTGIHIGLNDVINKFMEGFHEVMSFKYF